MYGCAQMAGIGLRPLLDHHPLQFDITACPWAEQSCQVPAMYVHAIDLHLALASYDVMGGGGKGG